MKEIVNWYLATTADIESDGLLHEATKFHVLSFHMANNNSGSIEGSNLERINKFFDYHIDNKIPVVFHNGILFDLPLSEKLLNRDLSDLMVIDTLALSWYLNFNRDMHGLDSFFEDYGIAKPKVDDWENLTYEEYRHRCEEDVKINVALWEDFKKRLIDMYTKTKHLVDNGLVNPKRMSNDEVTFLDQYVGTSTVDQYIDRCLQFLMFKLDCARLQEKTRWKVDVNYLEESFEMLGEKVQETLTALEAVMPPVPKYGKRKKPADPFKKDKTLKVQAIKWNEAVANIGKEDQWGNPLTKSIDGDDENVLVINKYEKPNANSSDQLKKFFFLHGWEPDVYKYVKDKEATEAWVKGGFRKEDKPIPRKIPQINKEGDDGKELCDSLIRLSEEVPEIKAYDGYSVAKHRYDTIKGFMRDMKDGTLQARIGGYTNTLRAKHREIVNLVGVDKPYGENVRGALTCTDDEILLGSDLSSLEDRNKHHFMLPHDPDYVETMMADDYDPHILTAHSAKMVTDEELAGFKAGTLSGAVKEAVSKARKGGKTTNYASVYGGSPEAIARGGGIDLELAKRLHKGYWELNWSVKAIAEEQCVFEDSRKQKWLINPINGICYSLRTEKDRFSTLCQGTGSFFFDMWVDRILNQMERVFGVKRLTGSFHDEVIICFKDTKQGRILMENLIKDSIDYVSKKYMLRRSLGCDVQFGKRYSQIH